MYNKCKLKFNHPEYRIGSEFTECEKEKCAWFVKKRIPFYNHSQGKQDIELKECCAIKLIAGGE